MRFLSLFVFASILALPVLAQEKDAKPIAIPLEGLAAACCEQPVQKELGKIEGVESAKVRKEGDRYFADVVVKKGQGLALSDVEKALGAATQGMGKAMGTTYKVGESLSVSLAYLFKTKAEPDEAKLKAALGSLDGFKSVRVEKGGFGVVFEGEKQPTLAAVRKAAGVEISDVVLAATRYVCPMHPDKVSLEPGKCPVCSMDMKVAAGEDKKDGCCGGKEHDCGKEHKEKKEGCGGCGH